MPSDFLFLHCSFSFFLLFKKRALKPSLAVFSTENHRRDETRERRRKKTKQNRENFARLSFIRSIAAVETRPENNPINLWQTAGRASGRADKHARSRNAEQRSRWRDVNTGVWVLGWGGGILEGWEGFGGGRRKSISSTTDTKGDTNRAPAVS